MATVPTSDRVFAAALVTIVAAGFALRLAAAQGGLWLDEAWSMVLAHDVGTPLGVFLSINHDNNHHLNALWLLLVGFDAPPLLVRGLAIVTGTIAIYVAGRIGARRGPAVALVTATLFAISPILVTLGSEARGYAPMALALLVAILLVDRWLDGDDRTDRRLALALCFGLGALAQLTMAFGVCALIGWAFCALWRRDGLRAAATSTARLFAPASATLAAVLAAVGAAAWASDIGFQFGSYEPFSAASFVQGLGEAVGYSIGMPWDAACLIAIAAILVVAAPHARTARIAFTRLAIVAFPLALVILHAGNVGHPRYYLLVSVALLLLIAELIANGLQRGGIPRWLAGAALASVGGASLAQDVDLINNRRADPAAAVRTMAAHAPAGAAVLLDRETGRAAVAVAAAQAHYPLAIVTRPCPPPRFVFADRFRGEGFPAHLVRCGRRYAPIAAAQARGLSGTPWTLYERQP